MAFLVTILLGALLVNYLCYSSDAKTWLREYSRSETDSLKRSDGKQCADKSRLALQLCFKKVAKNRKELRECAQIFLLSFPVCFNADPGSGDCQKACWISFGNCAVNSKSFAEQFGCIIHRMKCRKNCATVKDKRERLSILEKRLRQLLTQSNLESRKLPSFSRGIETGEAFLHETGEVNGIERRSKLESNTFDEVDVLHPDYNGPIAPISKRSACLSECYGLYEACLSNEHVKTVGDHELCLTARGICSGAC